MEHSQHHPQGLDLDLRQWQEERQDLHQYQEWEAWPGQWSPGGQDIVPLPDSCPDAVLAPFAKLNFDSLHPPPAAPAAPAAPATPPRQVPELSLESDVSSSAVWDALPPLSEVTLLLEGEAPPSLPLQADYQQPQQQQQAQQAPATPWQQQQQQQQQEQHTYQSLAATQVVPQAPPHLAMNTLQPESASAGGSGSGTSRAKASEGGARRNGRRGRGSAAGAVRRVKLYQVTEQFQDPEKEKRRLDAINSRKNRERRATARRELRQKVTTVTQARDKLRQEVEALHTQYSRLLQQLRAARPHAAAAAPPLPHHLAAAAPPLPHHLAAAAAPPLPHQLALTPPPPSPPSHPAATPSPPSHLAAAPSPPPYHAQHLTLTSPPPPSDPAATSSPPPYHAQHLTLTP